MNTDLRVITRFPPKNFLTLGTVLSLLPFKGKRINDFVYVVPDHISEFRSLLWELKDYKVSSVSGGSIWLIKR